jgi:glutaredoxin 2
MLDVTPFLTMPRYPLLPLPEFRTVAARDHFLFRKREAYPDMEMLRAKTRDYLSQLDPILEDLAQEIADPNAINGTLSRDDIRILPLLRSVAVVEGLEFPACRRGLLRHDDATDRPPARSPTSEEGPRP